MACPPAPTTSCSTCLPSASRTSPITTFAPSFANSRASTAPIPRAPPLISATLPASLIPSPLAGRRRSRQSIGCLVARRTAGVDHAVRLAVHPLHARRIDVVHLGAVERREPFRQDGTPDLGGQRV